MENVKENKTERNKRRGVMVRFAPYFVKYKGILIADLLCAALTTGCALVLPMIVREITNTALYDFESLTLQMVLTLGGFYMFLRLLDAFGTYFMASVGHIMGSRMETDMREDLFRHMQEMSFGFYSETKVGQLMARITTDLFDVTEFAHHCPEEYFIAFVKILGTFIILCTINVPLTLLIFIVVPIMLYVACKFNKKMKAIFRKQRVQVGEINAQVEDSLLGIRVVKSFGAEEVEIEKFKENNSIFLAIKKRSYTIMGGFEATNRLFDGLMYCVVVVGGAIAMMNGSINVADFSAFLLFVATLIESIRRVVQFTEQFQRGVTGVERFFEIMDIQPEIQDDENAVELGKAKGDIDFEDVSFCYSDGETEVLSKINLKIKSGENVALVGPSGGGKTTLCNLIPRFYDVTGGSIKVDGHDVRELTMQSLRKEIGFVQQDVYLFGGTVYQNIEYGKVGATREEVIESAKLAGAHDFICELKDGYDTYVGERGVKLSGGQKQRISIARAFLKNPPILILDEATSALDNESERLVQSSLEALSKGRTTFTIAHRLTTIKNAGLILVLTDKGVEEQGTHKELMSKGGIYHNLYSAYKEMTE
ncbi:MAG: ABC transporter ATP-binding protein [Bacillota bacterium]